jgi:hypothetical protein
MYTCIYYIGAYAPIILFASSLILLRHTSTYWKIFISGFIFNNIINLLLKSWIQQPRPINSQKELEIGINNGARIGIDKFGMPSGHAQNCAYCLAFITMTVQQPWITGAYTLITIMSLFQRYLYNFHTEFQIFIGSIIGLSAGYLTYILGNIYVTGDTRIKKDDEYMG